jgi:DNA-binding transcriptional LysR family regulator
MLSLDRLRVLHAVWTSGSVTGAAGALHVTTSAISQQLARLEREVGERLVERQGRGPRLTDVGTLLAHQAGELLGHVERVEAGLAEYRGAVSGTLTIATFATAARALAPAALGELRARYPDLRASLSEQEPHEAVPAVVRGDVDIAVVQDWAEDPLAVPDTLSRRHLADDRFDVALSAGHPHARRDSVAIAELADEDWIGWTSGQICHDWLLRTLGAHEVRPRIAHTASEHSTQLALVAAGLGTAVIPRLGREPVPGVRFVPVEPPPARRIFAVWRTSTSARPAIIAALDAFRDAATTGADR